MHSFADMLKAQLIESARAQGVKTPDPDPNALAVARALHEDEHGQHAERADEAAMLRAFGIEVRR